jgi:hypothetical protein
MARIERVNCAWQAWPGAPGVSTFYMNTAAPPQATIDAIRAFFNALVTLLPLGLTITVPNSGDGIDDTNGSIVGSWSAATPPAVVSGTSAAAYAGNAGSVVHWLTTTVVNNRRVRGRTFLVPLTSAAFQNDGSIATAALTTIQTAAAGLITTAADDLMVWHRPTAFAQGSSAVINGTRVPDLAVSLRSRRI